MKIFGLYDILGTEYTVMIDTYGRYYLNTSILVEDLKIKIVHLSSAISISYYNEYDERGDIEIYFNRTKHKVENCCVILHSIYCNEENEITFRKNKIYKILK